MNVSVTLPLSDAAFANSIQLITPILGAREHDSIRLYTGDSRDENDLPDPPATEVVNSAIKLFAVALPLQAPKIQESMLEQVATFLSTSSLHRDPGRKAAMTVNIATALLVTLMVAVKETGSAAGDLRSPAVERAIQEMLRVGSSETRSTLFLTMRRALSSSLTHLFATLALKPSAAYVTALEIPSRLTRSIISLIRL